MKLKVKKIPQANNGLVVEGDQYKALSPNTIELGGNPHSQGGTDISYFGNQIEAEKGETVSQNQNGDLVVWGNLKIPNTNTKFKNAIKTIGKEEAKAEKQSQKANDLVSLNDPYNKFENLSYQSGLVLEDAANIRKREAQIQKEGLGRLQDMMLNISNQTGIEPQDLDKAMNLPKAKDGKKLTKTEQEVQNWLYSSPDVYGNRGFQSEDRLSGYSNFTPMEGGNENVQRSLYNAAVAENIDPSLLLSLGNAESNFRAGVAGPKTKSGTAYGHVQFLPSTAKQYGVTEAQLKSKKQEDIDAVSRAGAKHLKSLLGKYEGDQMLALAAYNGGEGAVNSVRKSLGNPNASGQDVMQYWANQNSQNPSNDPSLWRNQTFNYVNTILGNTGSLAPTEFRNNYYNGAEGTPNYTPIPNNPPALTNVPNFLTPLNSNDQPQDNRINNNLLDEEGFRRAAGLRTLPSQETSQNITAGVNNRSLASSVQGTRNNLNPLDFIGEAAAIFDRPDYVPLQQYNPELLTPYRVTFQDQINQNNSNFNALRQQFANNPQALSSLSGQLYQQNQGVLGDEFRTNQGISNDITNRNNQILNQAELTNLQLADTQYQRQAGAQAITEQNRLNALNSVSNKFAQNRLVNNQLAQTDQRTRLMENFFDYRANPQGQLSYQGADATFNYGIPPMTPMTAQETKLATEQEKYKQQQQKTEQQRLRTQNRSLTSLLNNR